jgi:hypothetical protein
MLPSVLLDSNLEEDQMEVWVVCQLLGLDNQVGQVKLVQVGQVELVLAFLDRLEIYRLKLGINGKTYR